MIKPNLEQKSINEDEIAKANNCQYRFSIYYIIDEIVLEIDDVPLTSLYHQIVPNTLDAIICSCYILSINSAYRVQSSNFHPNQAE